MVEQTVQDLDLDKSSPMRQIVILNFPSCMNGERRAMFATKEESLHVWKSAKDILIVERFVWCQCLRQEELEWDIELDWVRELYDGCTTRSSYAVYAWRAKAKSMSLEVEYIGISGWQVTVLKVTWYKFREER